MAVVRYGNRDSAHIHRLGVNAWGANQAGVATPFSGPGTGQPYETDTGATANYYRGPIVESATGMLKIVQDISVPAAAIGANVNWASAGVYAPPVTNTNLVVFSYDGGADASKELAGRSSFFLLDVQVFYGAGLTGSSGPGTMGTTKLNLYINSSAGGSLDEAWRAEDVIINHTTGRICGYFPQDPNPNTPSTGTATQSRIIGPDAPYSEFVLQMSVAASSATSLTAGKIRLVMVGYEF